MSPHILGYASSLILLVTLAGQIHKQWKRGSSRGVSPWLFVGQLVASAGFTVYSALIDSRVFVITNACLAAAASIGLAIVIYHRVKLRHPNVREVLARNARNEQLAVPGSGRADVLIHRERLSTSGARGGG
jgi:MtN3 and saliva related transmembrane protein